MIDFDYCSPEVAVENWKECLIYGAGNRGREVLAVLRRKGVRVVGFLDSGGKAGSAVDGVPVLEPRELPPLSRDLPVVIAVFSYPVAGETARIVGDLLPLGYRKLIDFETFFQACREEFRDSCFWLEHPDYFRKHRDEITRAAALFEEEDSRNCSRRRSIIGWDSLIRFCRRFPGECIISPENFAGGGKVFPLSISGRLPVIRLSIWRRRESRPVKFGHLNPIWRISGNWLNRRDG